MNYCLIPGTGIIVLHNPSVPISDWPGRWKYIAEFDDQDLAGLVADNLNQRRAWKVNQSDRPNPKDRRQGDAKGSNEQG